MTLKLVKGKWTQADDVTDADDTTEAGTEAGSDSDSTISSLEGEDGEIGSVNVGYRVTLS